MNDNNVSEVKSKSNHDEVGTSSWNATCLRSASGPNLAQVSPLADSSHSASGLKSDEKSSSIPAQETAVLMDPPPDHSVEKSQDSTVASMLREIAEKTKIPLEKIDQAYSDIPVYHIRLEGCGEEPKQSGEKCILCDNDLSCSPNGVVRVDDEQKYKIKFIPQCLPAVDILPCGHAIHTECSKHVMSIESNVPQCILCLSMP